MTKLSEKLLLLYKNIVEGEIEQDQMTQDFNNCVADALELEKNNEDLLHDFFNSSSDANKYLEATQQEQLESDFCLELDSYNKR